MHKKVLIGVLGVSVLVASLGLNLSNVRAAAAPDLGAAASFSILAQTAITGTPTNISGDVGMNNFSSNITGLTGAVVGGTIYATDAVPVAPGEAVLNPAVQADASFAYTNDIPGQASDGAILPALDGQVLTPGVWDTGAGTLSGGVLTLDGAGIYIIRTSTSLTSSGSIEFINGARPCDLYWRVDSLATINGTSFAGTILAGTGVHFGAGVALDGRALAIGGDVTLNTNGSISGPTCDTPTPPSSGGPSTGEITVVKTVINDSGGTAVVGDFPLLMNGLFIASGVTNIFGTNVYETYDYTVTETYDPTKYVQSFSGDCDANGVIQLNPDDEKFCIITNNDIGAPIIAPIPPHISLVKVPNPLSLPAGPGEVTYAYTLSNTGTVPVTNITMIGDTCSPITLSSGDVNSNGILEVTETWVYHCTTTLTETHTNTVVAMGWANGISANDIASARVVVGEPIIPPLIHITKTPSRFTFAAGGGMVTYTKRVTNPGAVALSNVQVTDDKCSPVTFVGGDVNNNSLLDTNETWTYTCQTNITATTLNTAVATGVANGMIARDVATAIVTVAGPVPALPSTGSAIEAGVLMKYMVVIGMTLLMTVAGLVAFRKKVL